MRWPLALAMALALTGGLAGCRNRECRDVVERELRAREDDVRQLKGELDRAEFYNQSLSRELAASRGEPGPNGHVEKPSEPYPVRSIRLGRGTGGRAAECGGDDALTVQVEPIDCEGQTIKAPGCLTIEVLEVSKEGLKRTLSSWDIPKDKLRYKWQSGLFNTGYVVTFPWQAAPCTEKLRVVARFILLDGRSFEADKDITVRLMPEHQRRPQGALPPPSPAPATTLPGPTEVVPAPSEDIPPPPTPPPGVTPIPTTPPKATPTSTEEGPRLTNGRSEPRPRVQLLRPVPMPTDD
ncbi:MAG: hypothetical protein U0797_24835 [Gemmataceae bacterium]